MVDGSSRYSGTKVLASRLRCPPCNIGPRSTPDYADLAGAAVYDEVAASRCSPVSASTASCRSGFGVRPVDLRPFQNLHVIPTVAAAGVDALKSFSVHTIAIQVPIADLTPDGSVPTDPSQAISVVGCGARRAASRPWCSAAGAGGRRQHIERSLAAGVAVGQPAVQRGDRAHGPQGPVEQVAAEWGLRLPEIREASRARQVIPRCTRACSPNLASISGRNRDDLVAILLTGIPWVSFRVPELHGHDLRRHAAAQRRHPAGAEPEHPRHPRRRPGRVPERPPGVRRCRHHRVAGDRRGRHSR